MQKHLRLPREKSYFKEVTATYGLFRLQLKTEEETTENANEYSKQAFLCSTEEIQGVQGS